jgi:hypothetical protein
MWIILIIATLLCVVILVVRISESERVEEKKARIYNRDILSVTTIFQKFYSHANFDEEEFSEVWNEIANILKMEAGKLRPTDRFDYELKSTDGYPVEDEIVELEYYLRDECKKRSISLEEYKLETLDDFIREVLDKNKMR